MNEATVDSRAILRMFAELDSKRQKKVHKTTLSKATAILVKETKKNFRTVVRKPNSRNRWNNKTFISGIKSSVDRTATEGKVHIMGDFRLKFFETGTAERRTKGNRITGRSNRRLIRSGRGGNRGKITGQYFFRKARQSKEQEISHQMNSIIAQSIQRVNEQYRSR